MFLPPRTRYDEAFDTNRTTPRVTQQQQDSATITTDNQASYWLALLRAPGVGPATFQTLLQHFDSPQQIMEMPVATICDRVNLKPATRDYLRQPDWRSVEADMRWAEQPGNHIITLHDPLYPSLLRQINDPPPLLFVTGDAKLLQYPQLAMVGSRNPNHSGTQTAFEFASYLSTRGFVITSGLALGIDAASHRGALAGSGLTIAVAGTGLDRVYPAVHKSLAHEIAEQGALVSENVPGTQPRASQFPRRNRIISGLSMGTLVVEAAKKSGSLITARLAMEQGREVFAIPGSIHNPLARGCHHLIREGAKLVETGEDIIEELGPLLNSVMNGIAFNGIVLNEIPGQSAAIAPDAVSDEITATGPASKPGNTTRLPPGLPSGHHHLVFDIMGYEPATIDHLVEQSHLTAEAVSSILVELEIQGHIVSQGGLYNRVGTVTEA